MYPADSIACRDQQVAVVIFSNGENLVAGQAVPHGIDVPIAPELNQAAIMKPDPDSAAPVLIDSGRLVARQTFQHAEVGEGAVAKAIQPVVHAGPEVPFGVFVDATHPISLARISHRVGNEPVAFEPRQAAVSSDPKI